MNLVNNNKFTLVLLLCIVPFLNSMAQTYTGKNIKVNIFSSTPIEDIKAVSNSGVAVLALQNQELAIKIMIKSFEFDKKLMQEHFNENYMESDKFPVAKFKGVIEPKIDWTKEGEYNVKAKGTLTIHGVDQPSIIAGKITVKNSIATINTTFNVACATHQIKIPSLMFTKIAEIIQVKVQGNLTPAN